MRTYELDFRIEISGEDLDKLFEGHLSLKDVVNAYDGTIESQVNLKLSKGD